MKFSERLGYKPVKEQLQIESIDDELRNSLWSVFLQEFFTKLVNSYDNGYLLYEYCIALWFRFFKLPLDTCYIYSDHSVDKQQVQKFLRKFFFEKKNWFDPLDLIEFSTEFANREFMALINTVLEREKSAYRFVNGQITQITSTTEIAEIEEAINGNDIYKSVNIHLNTALGLLADRQNPDYRNSIKESISAVESMCKIFVNNDKATLGDTLSDLEKKCVLHPALKKAFSSLYGYTSDDGGIRHALTQGDRVIDFHEAKFMLVTCSSFINYLKSRKLQ
jgi:hypothetical protein